MSKTFTITDDENGKVSVEGPNGHFQAYFGSSDNVLVCEETEQGWESVEACHREDALGTLYYHAGLDHLGLK